jgi:hypothetical protein
MFGGPPITYVPAPQPRPPAPAPINPVPPVPVAAAPQAPRTLAVRGVPEEPEVPPPAPPPAPLLVPTPEQCDVAPRPMVAGTDWSSAHMRLDRLGATCFHLEHVPGGCSHCTCLVPGAGAGQTQHFEARAASDAEAVQLVLTEAEKWAATK